MKKVFEISWDDYPGYVTEGGILFCLQHDRDQRIKGLEVKEIPEPAGFDGLAGMCTAMAEMIKGLESRLDRAECVADNRHGDNVMRIKTLESIYRELSCLWPREPKPTVKPCPFCGKFPKKREYLDGFIYACNTEGCPGFVDDNDWYFHWRTLENWNKRESQHNHILPCPFCGFMPAFRGSKSSASGTDFVQEVHCSCLGNPDNWVDLEIWNKRANKEKP